MPEDCSEHVILAYFKMEFLSQTFKEEEIYDFIFQIDEKKEEKYKKQNFYFYLLLKLSYITLREVHKSVKESIGQEVLKHFEKDTYMTYFA